MKRLAATILDSVMIAYFNMIGEADGPCGKLQTWARMNRKGQQHEDWKIDPADIRPSI